MRRGDHEVEPAPDVNELRLADQVPEDAPGRLPPRPPPARPPGRATQTRASPPAWRSIRSRTLAGSVPSDFSRAGRICSRTWGPIIVATCRFETPPTWHITSSRQEALGVPRQHILGRAEGGAAVTGIFDRPHPQERREPGQRAVGDVHPLEVVMAGGIDQLDPRGLEILPASASVFAPARSSIARRCRPASA